jgi:uncharacterized protein YodC (DUF2158 family)
MAYQFNVVALKSGGPLMTNQELDGDRRGVNGSSAE